MRAAANRARTRLRRAALAYGRRQTPGTERRLERAAVVFTGARLGELQLLDDVLRVLERAALTKEG